MVETWTSSRNWDSSYHPYGNSARRNHAYHVVKGLVASKVLHFETVQSFIDAVEALDKVL